MPRESEPSTAGLASSTEEARPIETWLLSLGALEYGDALDLQRRLAEARAAGRLPDVLVLLEHPPVVTLGRRGSLDDVLVPVEELERRGIALHATSRGGLVTYHGPGQLVGYPILDLRAMGGDAHAYVRGLEEVILRFLHTVGLQGRRDPGYVGVWVDDEKVAAIGVAVSRGVTIHGFALNLDPDLDAFRLITPCGIRDRGVTSVARLLGRAVDPSWARAEVARQFAEVFRRRLRPTSLAEIETAIDA
ncbi:MAG TPA: lipoyl(octanoyl) transferase LipB [Chloroflexota bacterium]